MNPEDIDEAQVKAGSAHSAGGRSSAAPAKRFSLLAAVRTAIAGVLMGIANLIPGVSGGTMILAMGLYEEFVDSVADVTALRFSFRRVVFLGIIAAFAGGAIVLLAGVILYLLFHYTVAMFALFIGLTLGGAPLLLRLVRPIRADVVVAVLVGLVLMMGVLLLKAGSGMPHNTAMDFASGVVGSTTMVLPGVSGSYMLLVLDQYERVVGAVDDLKEVLRTHSVAALKDCMKVILPVGIGAILGIVALSNVLKWLLHRFRRATLGVLLGILLGSVIGLWPFSKVPSEEAFRRRTLAELQTFAARWRIPDYDEADDKEKAIEHILENWAERGTSALAVRSVGTALAFAAAGFALTYALGRKRLGDEGAGHGRRVARSASEA